MKEALECYLRRPLENAHLGGFSVRLAKHRAGAFIQQRHFGPSALDSFEASLVWAGKNRSENGGVARRCQHSQFASDRASSLFLEPPQNLLP